MRNGMSLKQLIVSLMLVFVFTYSVDHWNEPLTIFSGDSVAAAGSEGQAVESMVSARLSVEDCVLRATSVTVQKLVPGVGYGNIDRFDFWDERGFVFATCKRSTLNWPNLGSRFVLDPKTATNNVRSYVLKPE